MIITVSGNLKELLRPPFTGMERIVHELDRQASVKDIIESFGIPHTEVGRLTIDGREIPFSHPGSNLDTLNIHPHSVPMDVSTPTLLRPETLPAVAFAADMNVGKLAALLRMAGCDTWYHNEISDPELIRVAQREQRILLSRDKDLLKRREVVFGYLIRENQPEKQLDEVVRTFAIRERLRPLSRCMRCNGELQPVAKELIIDRLEPLTRKYYDAFRQCPGCNRIYWPGSHRDKMLQVLARYGEYRDPA